MPCPGPLPSSHLFNHVCDLCLFFYTNVLYIYIYIIYIIYIYIYTYIYSCIYSIYRLTYSVYGFIHFLYIMICCQCSTERSVVHAKTIIWMDNKFPNEPSAAYKFRHTSTRATQWFVHIKTIYILKERCLHLYTELAGKVSLLFRAWEC